MCFLLTIKMNTLSAYVAINNCILCQAGIGILSNNFLFFHIFTLLQYQKPKLTDLICCHLALVHIIMLLTVLFWRSPDLFESLNFFNDFKCKALFYIIRVMRSLSICTTCFLSIVQAITISSSTSWLAQLKHKSTHLIFLSLLWFLCLCFSTSTIFYTVANSNVTQTNVMVITKYCSFFPISHSIRGFGVHTNNIQRHLPYRSHAALKCVHGDPPTQASEEVPVPSQHQPLPKILPREKGHPDHPAAGQFLCGHALCGLHHLILLNDTVVI